MSERSAKEIRLAPISSQSARKMVEQYHYSKRSVRNSQLHLGVFLDDRCKGVLSFGPCMDKQQMIGLVRGTGWNEFLELNRMALADDLPRNGESRALAVAMRMIRKNAPHIKWVVSFADGCQCGDGTIYRAAGFVLTNIRKNKTMWRAPDGSVVTDLSLKMGDNLKRFGGAPSVHLWRAAGYAPLQGFQFRYIYFLDPTYRARLTVPEVPFSAISDAMKMYKGERVK